MLLETFLGSFPLFVGCGFSANLAHRGGEGQPDSDSELTRRLLGGSNFFLGCLQRTAVGSLKGVSETYSIMTE